MDSVKIIFLGDVSFSGQNAGNATFVDSRLKELFKTADAVICNFESTFTQVDELGLFQSHVSSVRLLKEAGITHAIVANNHIYDYGHEGLENTVSILKSSGVEPLGLKRLDGLDQGITSFKIGDINIGLLCSGWTRVKQSIGDPFIYWEYDEKEIATTVELEHLAFDHLVVVCHKGKMFVEYPSPKDKRAYHNYINLGASMVVAHHPHVVQGVYAENNKLIAYSLGNFYFDSEEGHIHSKYSKHKQDLGLAVIVDFDKQRLLDHQMIPVKRSSSGVVKLDAHESLDALRDLKKLSKNTRLPFVSNGYFYGQYLRHVVPHFLRVFLHHKLKG